MLLWELATHPRMSSKQKVDLMAGQYKTKGYRVWWVKNEDLRGFVEVSMKKT